MRPCPDRYVCPECNGWKDPDAKRCRDCYNEKLERQRKFCPYCGTVIDPRSTTCKRHADLPALDWRYAGGVESDAMVDDGSSDTAPGDGLQHSLRHAGGGCESPRREDVQATRERSE